MRNHSGIRSAVVAASILAVAMLAADVAEAQQCRGVPVIGSRLLVDQRIVLQPDELGPVGDNLVGIPAFSSINTAEDPDLYGFKGICEACGLTGTASMVQQFNAQTGIITTHFCDQALAPEYAPCQGVMIRLAPGLGRTQCSIPAGETSAGEYDGSWNYPLFGNGNDFGSLFKGGPVGDSLFGVPASALNTEAQALCDELGLPYKTRITRLDAATGQEESQRCGVPRIEPLLLKRGEAVWIRTPGDEGMQVMEMRVDIE